ncbi:MAG TPA: hypothetical protein VIL72_12210, partial [Beijerinckiaceae bacterium]
MSRVAPRLGAGPFLHSLRGAMSITDIGGRATRRPAGLHAFTPHPARGSSRPADEAVAGEPPSGRVADFVDAASLEALDAAGAEGAEAARLARAWAE